MYKNKFDQDGNISPEYARQIKNACEAHSIFDFKIKLKEIEKYFTKRKDNGWPNVKTSDDLEIECHLEPFIHHCIQYLNGELKI